MPVPGAAAAVRWSLAAGNAGSDVAASQRARDPRSQLHLMIQSTLDEAQCAEMDVIAVLAVTVLRHSIRSPRHRFHASRRVDNVVDAMHEILCDFGCLDEFLLEVILVHLVVCESSCDAV